jgi:RHH-type proline utilization regulon transcriptional repressor/proline dehydrogenase/delta 1-pyrroline-5-carboxylate dehydrogenase
MVDTSAIEALTQQRGREIFTAAREAEASANGDEMRGVAGAGGGGRWLDRQMMRLAAREEQLKAQLFRFVDVLPALRSDAEVNAHLREYLGQIRDRLPRPIGKAIDWWPTRDGWAGRLVAGLARANTRRLARRFIAASDEAEAFETIKRLRALSLAVTIDLLGEAVLSESEAAAYQQSYLRLIEMLAPRVDRLPTVPLIDSDHRGPLPRLNVSVKLSSLYSQFDPIDPRRPAARCASACGRSCDWRNRAARS